MTTRDKIVQGVWAFVALFIVGALLGLLVNQPAMQVSADAVTNYYTSTWSDGATAYTTTGGSTTGQDVSGYGSAVIHVIADASATTSTLTVYPMYSNAVVNCSTVTDWFTGTDYIAYSQGATYYVPIATTVNTTSSLPITSAGATTVAGNMPYVVTTTYTYGSATQLSAAAASRTAVAQSFTTTGDTYTGREVRVYGRCMKLAYAVSYGTITPTAYVMTRDIQ
jgi:hypothetical protein